MQVTKRIEFDAAHRLLGHRGKCANLHGHRYALEVRVKPSSGLDGMGMVADFGQLKAAMNVVVEKWDHRCILERRDPLVCAIIESGENAGQLVVLEVIPTVENMAVILHQQMTEALEKTCPGVVLAGVRLYETPSSWCDFETC